MFSFFHLTHLVQLLHLGKLSRSKYQATRLASSYCCIMVRCTAVLMYKWIQLDTTCIHLYPFRCKRSLMAHTAMTCCWLSSYCLSFVRSLASSLSSRKTVQCQACESINHGTGETRFHFSRPLTLNSSELNWTYRRIRGDAIETFKYMHNIYSVDSSTLIPLRQPMVVWSLVVTVWNFRKEIVRYRREQMFLVSVLLTFGMIYRSIW